MTKIAIGDPKSVPAGTYAQAAFDELGITARIQSKFVLGANVTQVLTYVASGNVDVGFVYSTDALSSNQVKVVAQAPADINALIVYPAAIIQAPGTWLLRKHTSIFCLVLQPRRCFNNMVSQWLAIEAFSMVS